MPRSGPGSVTTLSPVRIGPDDGSANPAMAFSSVDLPQPEAQQADELASGYRG
jgi:hypothetical protein